MSSIPDDLPDGMAAKIYQLGYDAGVRANDRTYWDGYGHAIDDMNAAEAAPHVHRPRLWRPRPLRGGAR
ncbi:MAG TPA: hypothetical protein VKB69_08045 [Micromonosporaceae bacterium]|nr:hypothetical protein [Micromonosporaceae bacterium]